MTREMDAKLDVMRDVLERHHLGALRLRGNDWFAWATCGGSNGVFLATERGVGEVVVTRDEAVILTDEIEEQRLRDEENPAGMTLVAFPWADRTPAQAWMRDRAGGKPVASDVPAEGEAPLPPELVAAKRRLLPEEIERYRALGRDAAAAMTETLLAARADATEHEMAGLGAAALWRRGVEPVLVLVAGAARAPRYRHARPTSAVIGERVSMVMCGRRAGLVANLTRHAFLRTPSADERADAAAVAEVEAAAWDASQPGTSLADVYATIVDAYVRVGHRGAERWHHQGGTTGYLSREVIATPSTTVRLEAPVALAWNPSLPGAKIEDTVVRSAEGLEILTVDPAWPTVEVAGRPRPDLYVLG